LLCWLSSMGLSFLARTAVPSRRLFCCGCVNCLAFLPFKYTFFSPPNPPQDSLDASVRPGVFRLPHLFGTCFHTPPPPPYSMGNARLSSPSAPRPDRISQLRRKFSFFLFYGWIFPFLPSTGRNELAPPPFLPVLPTFVVLHVSLACTLPSVIKIGTESLVME